MIYVRALTAAAGSLALLLIVGACVHHDDGAASTATSEEPLNWLVGCWETDAGQTREVWVREGTGHLFGHNVVRRDGDVVFFEQLRLTARSDDWVYSAYPNGVGPTEFTLVEQGQKSARFENPAHDFPQVITYERTGGGLTAEVSTLDGSNPQTWVYARCADQ